MNIYTKHNTIHHDPEIPEGYSLIHLGTPSSSTCPYDVYARYIVVDAKKCFRRAGIELTIHTCHRRIASVGHGSGRGGAVRFGDDMLPPDVQAVVLTEKSQAARDAWELYRFRKYGIHRPVTVVGELHYTDGAWRRGGTWPYVCGNALALATALSRPGDFIAKLEAYASRHPIP